VILRICLCFNNPDPNSLSATTPASWEVQGLSLQPSFHLLARAQ